MKDYWQYEYIVNFSLWYPFTKKQQAHQLISNNKKHPDSVWHDMVL